jgi:hypothetical protein
MIRSSHLIGRCLQIYRSLVTHVRSEDLACLLGLLYEHVCRRSDNDCVISVELLVTLSKRMYFFFFVGTIILPSHCPSYLVVELCTVGSEENSDNALEKFPEIFWATVACMYTDMEYELFSVLKLLKVLNFSF